MIIVEGADNCGKSTLIEQLVALDPSLRILHRDKFKPDRGETIGTSYLNVLMPPPDGDRGRHGHGIIDRFFASECIYGELYRGGCRMTPNEHFTIKSLLLSYGAFVIWCDPGDAAVQATWAAREQLYDRDPLEIVRAYRKRVETIFYPLSLFRYNYTAADAAERRQLFTNIHHSRDRQFSSSLNLMASPHSTHTDR